MGPAVLITIGVLFLIGQNNWEYGFHHTWPVILLVVGAVKLAESLASTEGHGTPPGAGGMPPGPGPQQGPGVGSGQPPQQS